MIKRDCVICQGTGEWQGSSLSCPSCLPLTSEIDEITSTVEFVRAIPDIHKPGWGDDRTDEEEEAYTHLINNAIEWLSWFVDDWHWMYEERNYKNFLEAEKHGKEKRQT